MDNFARRNIIYFLLVCSGFGAFSQNHSDPQTRNEFQNLVDYKNSVHPLFVGYLVEDRNDPPPATSLRMIPDSMDMVEIFGRDDTSKADWQVIQAKGTKIIKCIFPSAGYFDGSVRDPATRVPGYIRPEGLDSLKPTPASTYYHYARDLYDRYITTNHWDGLDVDIESGTFARDIPLGNASTFLKTVAQYFGPNCTSCVVPAGGKKPILIYDTDSSADDQTHYIPFKDNYDFAFFQAYTGGKHYWKGSGVASFPPLVAMYGLDKFIPMVNGDDWLHANGKQDEPPYGDSNTTASLLDYARWCAQNGGRGVGAYRMSRDYNHTPSFGASRSAIQIMNPPGSAAGKVSGKRKKKKG